MASEIERAPGFACLRWRKRQILFGLCIGAVLLSATLRTAPLQEIAAALAPLDRPWAATAVACYALDLALRTVRWRILLATAAPASLGLIARALVIGYGLNILLPARLGELARIEHLKFCCGSRRSRTLPSLLLERSFD